MGPCYSKISKSTQYIVGCKTTAGFGDPDGLAWLGLGGPGTAVRFILLFHTVGTHFPGVDAAFEALRGAAAYHG